MTIHDTGFYSVSMLAKKHYMVYYEDKYEVRQIKSFTNELSAIKFCEMMEKKVGIK